MSKVTWLHISDMHISRPGGDSPVVGAYNQEKVLLEFLDYVSGKLPGELQRIGMEPPSLVFVTGDLAFAGKKQDYEGPETGRSATNCAKEFLRELGQRVNIPPAEAGKRIFLVAGNHDVCRDSAFLGLKHYEAANLELAKNAGEVDELLLGNSEEQISARRQILKRLGPYCDFYREFKGLPKTTNPEDILWYAEPVSFSAGSRPVYVVGLCSSWLCHSHWLVKQKGGAEQSAEEPTSHLPLGGMKTKSLLDKVPDDALCIALMHHDCDAINAKDALEHIHGKCHLVLSGHGHDDMIWARPLGGISHRLQAGSLYEQKGYRNTFNLVELDLDSDRKTVRMVTIEWHAKNGWQIDRGANPLKQYPSPGYKFDETTGVLTFPLVPAVEASDSDPVKPPLPESEPVKRYFGKSRSENLDWLADNWLVKGPPVCFLEGFPGLGKSDLALELVERAKKNKPVKHAVYVELVGTSTPSVVNVLMELAEELSQEGLPEMEEVLLGQENPNLGRAVEAALKTPILIVLDESQNFFKADSGIPLPEWRDVLAHLRNRPDLPGRLLLLSDRMVERARWSDGFRIRTLKKLEPEEAMAAFDDKLRSAGVTEAIAERDKLDSVQTLDYNPRALQALASALAFDSLKEIMGSKSGLWDVKDREVSRDFLDKLEKELLERTMAHLSDLCRQRLIKLAVHRKGFKKEALMAVCATNSEEAEVRTTLITRYLLDHHPASNFFKVNLIVREISLARLGDSPSEFKKAHSDAADYYIRPFKAKQMVGNSDRLAVSFAELRYHLVKAERAPDLREVCLRFTDRLKQEIKSVSPVPANRDELDERIGVLSALLENEGAKGLEYHLARCLRSRRRPGDLKQAVIHATRATGPGAPAHNWRLRAELEAVVNGVDVAIQTVRKAIRVVPASAGLVDLYCLGADLLTGAKRTADAVALLREGIKVPGMTGLFSLYQSCAEILSRDGKSEDAVALLRDGIKVPGMTSLSSLYQSCAEILSRDGKSEDAVALLREGIKVIPKAHSRYKLVEAVFLICIASGKGRLLDQLISAGTGAPISRQQILFGNVLKCQDQGDWFGAAETAKDARTEFPSYLPLAGQEAWSRLGCADPEGAKAALAQLSGFVDGTAMPHTWLAAFAQLRCGADDEARELLALYLGRPLAVGELSDSFLLRLWDEQVEGFDSIRLCFHYPILPAFLSGLKEDVRRIQGRPPVLPGVARVPENEASSRSDGTE